MRAMIYVNASIQKAKLAFASHNKFWTPAQCQSECQVKLNSNSSVSKQMFSKNTRYILVSNYNKWKTHEYNWPMGNKARNYG